MNPQLPMPDLQPTLTGETVILRPLHADDWPEMFKAAADPLIWEQHPARDRYLEPVFRGFFDGGLASGGAFAILDRGTGAIIGSSRYHGYNPERREIEIGWTFVTRAYWGGRTNAEIKRLMLDHAFSFAETVIFWVGATNLRSRRAMQKLGAVERPGLHTRALAGGAQPHVVFEIRKPLPA